MNWKNGPSLLLIVMVALQPLIPVTLNAATGTMTVGAARIDITPTDGARTIYGNAYVRVLVMDVNGYRVGVISVDLLKYEDRRIIEIARKRFNITELMICASHCHRFVRVSDYNDPYPRRVENAMVEGLEQAVQNMFPARVAAGYGRELPPLGYNRLTGCPPNAGAMWVNYERIPYGPVDPEVGVMRIDDESGRPRVILMNYACHAVSDRNSQGMRSTDYPGVACAKVEAALGDQTVCLFVQGGAGEVNPLFMTPAVSRDNPKPVDYSPMEMMGGLLAQEVLRVSDTLKPQPRETSTLTAMADSLHFTGRYEKQRPYPVHFTTVLINGEIAIASIPGEPFLRHQWFWKERVKSTVPLFFGYTFSDGGIWPGYIPDIRSSARGGYGADMVGSDNTGLIEIGAGEAIMNRQLINLYRLQGMMRETPSR